MNEMRIEKGMVIDDVACVKAELQMLAGRKIRDMEVVRKFICFEKHTKFFIDKNLNSSVIQGRDDTYVWLDSGFCDEKGNSIFIGLTKCGCEFIGHQVGTARILAERMRACQPGSKKQFTESYSRFISKYNLKCTERTNKHIDGEDSYFLNKANEDSECDSEMAKKIRLLNVEWIQDVEVEEEASVALEEETLNEEETEITIDILLDMLDKREAYIQELLERIESTAIENDAKTRELIEQIKEQAAIIKEKSDALTRIRLFEEKEAAVQFDRNMRKEEKRRTMVGHSLLEEHKKILIFGTSNLSAEVMKAIITKEYGFDKADFVFETDYEKIVHSSGRICNSSRYQAIIFGCCPHNAQGKGNWSSIIERLRQSADAPFVVDARNMSGNLKVTKESFRRALDEICENLSEAA